MKLNELKNKRILILGLGKEGIDNFKFLRKMFPKKTLGIADKQEISNFPGPSEARNSPEGCFPISNLLKRIRKVKLHLGPNYLKAIKNYDVIIKSPGVPIHLPEVERAYKQGKVTSQTEIFLENFRGKIIGVTGTKGKGTTAFLIYQILKKGGLMVHLGGNIGKPVLAALSRNNPAEIFVYEMSSHQLYKIKKSPQIAVLLNISPAHLDYYRNFKEYKTAKTNILKYQKKEDFLIYNSEDKLVREIAKKSKAKKIPFCQKDAAKFFRKHRSQPRANLNISNIAAAIAVGKLFEVSAENIIKAIKNFKPLPHRLEFVGKYRGVAFYDDSAATVPDAVCHALDTLENSVQTIILGGYECNLSFQKLAKKILKSGIKTLILFPTTGEKIWKDVLRQAKDKVIPRHFFADNMKDAVRLCYKNTKKGKICLLSCASPSFGLFKDYKQRGNLFKKYVKQYKKEI